MDVNNCYKILYDFNDVYPRLFPSIFGILCALLGFLILKSLIKKRINNPNPSPKIFALSILLIIFGMSFFFITINLRDYIDINKQFKSDNMLVIEGYVANKQIKHGRHNQLLFSIDNKHFVFLDNNHISSYGCHYEDLEKYPLFDSSYLRIHYINDDHPITLKMEVRCEATSANK